MNYLLIHDGPLPRHLKYCINQIRTIDEDSSIYLGINTSSNIKNATVINLQDIVSSRTEEVINMNLFSSEENRLWATSLLRIFYLYDLAKKYNIKEFIHFDNDVLIFKKYNELKSNFDFNKFNITPLTNDQLIFGYSFIPSIEVYAKIVDSIYSILFELSEYEKESLKSKTLNEMKLLNMVYEDNKDLFNLLNILPGSSDTIFDPASYGQFLTGTKDRFSKGFTDSRHIAGKEIFSGNVKPLLNKKYPEVTYDNKLFQLANLHVHSKKLKKYSS